MTINTKSEGTKMTIEIEGRLDTTSSPQLEAELGEKLENVENLVLDFEKLQYISSSGLRVLLATQKKMNAKKGTMVIRNVNELIMDVFDATGFVDILTIEND